jgi:hypothetical protein
MWLSAPAGVIEMAWIAGLSGVIEMAWIAGAESGHIEMGLD